MWTVIKRTGDGFFQYRPLLAKPQWQLLKAIANQDKLYKPNAKAFLARHKVGTPSKVQRLLEALLLKEMIYKEMDDDGACTACTINCWQGGWSDCKKVIQIVLHKLRNTFCVRKILLAGAQTFQLECTGCNVYKHCKHRHQ